jgi:hypothetical protein
MQRILALAFLGFLPGCLFGGQEGEPATESTAGTGSDPSDGGAVGGSSGGDTGLASTTTVPTTPSTTPVTTPTTTSTVTSTRDSSGGGGTAEDTGALHTGTTTTETGDTGR